MGDRSFVSIVVGSDTRSVQEIYLPGSFERHLQDPIAEFGAVERIDSDKSVLVIGHRYEAVAFALLSLEIANDLDAGDGAVGSKQLPQNVLVSSGGEVVDEDADAEAWGLADGGLGHRGRSGASHAHAAEQLWRDSGVRVGDGKEDVTKINGKQKEFATGFSNDDRGVTVQKEKR